ncbi:hypothetical protein TYRP_020339 [Tyrophagus putrescentiae]|nr:hypothetical protein TYRP_020339 [Tyrophagus putrescentiae]
MVDSRWLVMPTVRMSSAEPPLAGRIRPTTSSMQSTTDWKMASGHCSTHSVLPWAVIFGISFCEQMVPVVVESSSMGKSMKRELLVPWSMAPMYFLPPSEDLFCCGFCSGCLLLSPGSILAPSEEVMRLLISK